MNKKKWFSSKGALSLLTTAGIVGFFITGFSRQIGLCPNYSYSFCGEIVNELAEILSIFLVIGLFLLITFRMSNNVFRSWSRFTYYWIPISFLFVFIAPEYGSGGFGPSVDLDKGFVAFIMMSLFAVISTMIIVWKYIAMRFRKA